MMRRNSVNWEEDESVACIGAATTPIPYMQLAPTMSAAEEPDQKTLAGANRRHGEHTYSNCVLCLCGQPGNRARVDVVAVAMSLSVLPRSRRRVALLRWCGVSLKGRGG